MAKQGLEAGDKAYPATRNDNHAFCFLLFCCEIGRCAFQLGSLLAALGIIVPGPAGAARYMGRVYVERQFISYLKFHLCIFAV